MRASFGISISALLMLAACQQQAAQPVDEPSEAPSDPLADATKASVQLGGGGIVVPAQAGDAQLELPFGSLRNATETSLAAVLGEKTGSSAQDECPVGPVMTTDYDDMTLSFQNDKFAGWMAEGQYLPTETLGEFKAQQGVTAVPDSTLGSEYTMGEEGGPIITVLFDGTGDDAKASKMWAGANCIFR